MKGKIVKLSVPVHSPALLPMRRGGAMITRFQHGNGFINTTDWPAGSLPGDFDVRVTLEAARPLVNGFECRVRMSDGTVEEDVVSAEEAQARSGTKATAETKPPLANADQFRLLAESARFRLAYAPAKHPERAAKEFWPHVIFDIPAAALAQAAFKMHNYL